MLQTDTVSTAAISPDRGRPLRVCFYVFFPGGGIGRYTRELVAALNESPTIETEIACTPDFEWRDDARFETWDGLRSISHPWPLLRRTRFVHGQFFNPRRFIAHAVATRADVVHFANINHLTFPFWRKALRRAGMGVAVSVHDVQRQKSIVSRAWEDRQLKAFYQLADALFVHSDYQACELQEWAGAEPSKIHVVPHGSYSHGSPSADRETIRHRIGLPEDRQVALFFGQIRDDKNLEGLIRAIAQCSGEHLLVAGQAGARHRDIPYFRRLAGHLGIERYVTFLDRYIEEDEVADLFTAADWVALPYSECFTSQSGVLNVAANYRRPVLVSSSPVLQETVRQCDIGIACGGDGPSALQEGIYQMRDRIINGGFTGFDRYQLRYSWQANASRTELVYRSIVDEAWITRRRR